MRIPHCLALLVLASPLAGSAAAQPEPLDAALFAFPGSVVGPGSAASAGMALADRWLGDEPFSNPAARLSRGTVLSPPVTAMARMASPAARLSRGVVLSPALGRISRQDLRSDNRNYDETPAFLDAAAGWLALPVGPVTTFAYGWQAVLRNEDNAFQRGINQPQPATVSTTSSQREVRAGVGGSIEAGAFTVGVAGEWTMRSDRYETKEESGSPLSGLRTLDFDGSGIGGQAGIRWDHRADEAWGVSIGAGARWIPALDLEGEQHFELLVGDSTGAIAGERESGVEAGLSARLTITPAFRVVTAVGGRSARTWSGFGVTEGAGAEWRVGLDFHDARDPWTLRFGIGQEQQRGVPEPRASVIGLGLGWLMETTRLDLGVIRRAITRSDQPTSFDDRVVGTVTVAF